MAPKKTTAVRQPKSPKKTRSAESVRPDKKKDKTSQRKLVIIRCKGKEWLLPQYSIRASCKRAEPLWWSTKYPLLRS